MDDGTMKRGEAIVVQPDQMPSYWQPVPANGYSEIHITPEQTGTPTLSMGIQAIAPGCYIREHWHDRNEEVLHFLQGEGTAYVDGVPYPIKAGTTIYVGPWRKHKFVNEGKVDLKMLWVLTPPGLENFFAGIGRPRTPGQPAPEPFARPDNVAEIERRTVFAGLDGAASKQLRDIPIKR
ncbi:MAG: cupin domain-containing protein [Alphaproteobacteria bacterium]|nr:cupin domain-containing protein [Alphaproteobacteria bacterium]